MTSELADAGRIRQGERGGHHSAAIDVARTTGASKNKRDEYSTSVFFSQSGVDDAVLRRRVRMVVYTRTFIFCNVADALAV